MKLLRNDIRRALCSPWFQGSMLLLVVLAVIAAGYEIDLYVNHWRWIIEEYANESYYYHKIYSCFVMWLPLRAWSDVSSLFFALLPLLTILGFAWSYAQDVHNGYIAQLATRVPRARFYMARYAAVFISAGLLAVVPIVVNLLLLACFLPAYAPSLVDGMYISMGPTDIFASVFFAFPFLYVVLRCCLNFVLCGLWAVMVLGFSTLTTNRIALVCLPYIALLLVKHVGESFYVMMRQRGYERFGSSITLFDQLKSTGDSFFCYWWVTLICALIMLGLSLGIPYLRRRMDIL